MYIDIVEIWFGIDMSKFRQFLTELSACDTSIFSFLDENLSMSKYQLIFARILV